MSPRPSPALRSLGPLLLRCRGHGAGRGLRLLPLSLGRRWGSMSTSPRERGAQPHGPWVAWQPQFTHKALRSPRSGFIWNVVEGAVRTADRVGLRPEAQDGHRGVQGLHLVIPGRAALPSSLPGSGGGGEAEARPSGLLSRLLLGRRGGLQPCLPVGDAGSERVRASHGARAGVRRQVPSSSAWSPGTLLSTASPLGPAPPELPLLTLTCRPSASPRPHHQTPPWHLPPPGPLPGLSLGVPVCDRGLIKRVCLVGVIIKPHPAHVWGPRNSIGWTLPTTPAAAGAPGKSPEGVTTPHRAAGSRRRPGYVQNSVSGGHTGGRAAS